MERLSRFGSGVREVVVWSAGVLALGTVIVSVSIAFLPTPWQIGLGAGVEGLGFLLVIWELVRTVRQIEYLFRDQTVEVPLLTVGTSLRIAYATGEREPTLEERVARLEASLRSTDTRLDQQRTELINHAEEPIGAAEERMDRARLRLQAEIEKLVQAVRGGTRLRIAGTGLFIVGLIVSTYGNLASAP